MQRERRKAIKRQEEYEQDEMNLEAEADAAGQENTAGGQGISDQGEPGGLQQKKKAAPPEIRIQDMIPYLLFHRDVTNEEFRRLADQLKPWGVPYFVYGRREHMRHLEERGVPYPRLLLVPSKIGPFTSDPQISWTPCRSPR